jgi:hypothetical protein
MRSAVIVHGRRTWRREFQELDMTVVGGEDDLGSGETGHRGYWRRTHGVGARGHCLYRWSVAGLLRNVLRIRCLVLEG